MVNRTRQLVFVLGSLFAAGSAHAHFVMMKPDDWLKDADGFGGPQKGAPCGPGGADSASAPKMPTGMVTTFHAGESFELDVTETVHHQGYFRVSLAETSAQDATVKDFPNPPLTDTQKCSLDLDAVPTEPHDNVIADGLFKDPNGFELNRKLSQTVTLPNKPCDKCVLQVMQIMMDHGGSSCFYYHCADIKIVAADGGEAGVSGSAGTSGSAGKGGSAGSGSSTKPATAKKSSGCNVSPGAREGASLSAWLALALVSAAVARARRRFRQ